MAVVTANPPVLYHNILSPGPRPSPSLTPGRAEFPRISSPSPAEKETVRKMTITREESRLKMPPKIVRMATVSVTSRSKGDTQLPDNYQGSIKRPKRIITWTEATNNRPPLRIDMDGPTPCTYTTHLTKPLHETNSPSWTFGRKISSEKAKKGSRTSWEKVWFQSANPWSYKVNFTADKAWPSPNTYKSRPALGAKLRTFYESPSYTFGDRSTPKTVSKGGPKPVYPSPDQYDREKSDVVTHKRAPAYSHSFRNEGTVLWSGKGFDTPGPGSYELETDFAKPHRPAFSIVGIRRNKAHELGPFATF